MRRKPLATIASPTRTPVGGCTLVLQVLANWTLSPPFSPRLISATFHTPLFPKLTFSGEDVRVRQVRALCQAQPTQYNAADYCLASCVRLGLYLLSEPAHFLLCCYSSKRGLRQLVAMHCYISPGVLLFAVLALAGMDGLWSLLRQAGTAICRELNTGPHTS